MRRPVILIGFFVSLVSCAWCWSADRPRFLDKYALDANDVRARDAVTKGSATLSISNKNVQIGKRFSIDLRFTNEGRGGRIFNPFFRGKIPRPATIAVFDASKQYVGSYLSAPLYSYTGTRQEDWVYVSGKGYVGTTLSLLAGHLPGATSTDVLPPGRYFLQAIYNKGFVNFRNSVELSKIPPEQFGETLIELYGSYDHSELFRSNIVEIEFLPAQSSGADDQ